MIDKSISKSKEVRLANAPESLKSRPDPGRPHCFALMGVQRRAGFGHALQPDQPTPHLAYNSPRVGVAINPTSLEHANDRRLCLR